MTRRPIRIATTIQLERSVRAAGFETCLLPPLPDRDFNRPLAPRFDDAAIYRPFLEKNRIDLVIDFNTEAITLVRDSGSETGWSLATHELGIPHVSLFLDPVTSTMGRMEWNDSWRLLESNQWIKGIFESAHAQELTRLGVPNVLYVPMAAADDDFDTTPLPEPDAGPVLAFMGHPASSWFRSEQPVLPWQLQAGLTAAAVRADMPDVAYHDIYYDLYGFAAPPLGNDDAATRARKAADYYNNKFVYNAYLAVKQRDRFARFLKRKLGDLFELVGDHWMQVHGLPHTPRVWDMKALHERMRRVPICLNMMKGNIESGLIIRHFEITAYGGFMLTYPTPELPSFFEVGSECAIFHSEHDLLEKIHHYLDHADERREIAIAGQRRTLAEHLYSHRIIALVDSLRHSGVLSRPPQSQQTEPDHALPAERSMTVEGVAPQLITRLDGPECEETANDLEPA